MIDTSKQSNLFSISTVLERYKPKKKSKYINHEFQDYGYRLALELNDLQHRSLYMRLAKEENRSVLETAKNFVVDSRTTSKAKLFMWKLKQLREGGTVSQ